MFTNSNSSKSTSGPPVILTASQNSKLKIQPPQKHVDKSQKQQFVVEFPPDLVASIGSIAVNIDRRHFLPPVLLTGIAKQQKEEKGKNGTTIPAQGDLSIQILSREDKEITFEKCERCQEKDSHIFPLFEKMDASEEKEKQHPRNCFALIGCDKVQFDKGKAMIPIYFRCCPTHHTSKKGENFVKFKVSINRSVIYESDFVKVQWKKGKHSRIAAAKGPVITTAQPSLPIPAAVPIASTSTTTNSPNSSSTTTFNTPNVPSAQQTPVPTIPSSACTTTPAPVSSSAQSQCTASSLLSTPSAPSSSHNSPHVQLPNVFNSPAHSRSSQNNNSSTANLTMSNNPFVTINPGVPPYQAYMNMFQHLQNYYVQPLEEENKKLRRELTDSTRSVSGLKEENRKLRETMFTHKPDEHFLDQLKSYQYEINCSPSFLTFDDEDDIVPYDDEELMDEKELTVLPSSKSMRQAIKFMKFKSNIKLILLKHNGTHWFEPIDRVSSPHYQEGERLGIRIINKNRFPVQVRLHKINYANTAVTIPLSNEDFLRIEGCRDEEGSWETAYFDLGICRLPKESTEAVELLKLLVTTSIVPQADRLSTILVKSFTIRQPTPQLPPTPVQMAIPILNPTSVTN